MTKRGRGLVSLAGTPPCVGDCPRRSATCHAECQEYAAYAAERAAVYEQRGEMFHKPKAYMYEVRVKRARHKIRRRERGL